METNKKSVSIKSWFTAIRPRTLPAALAPIVVGTAMAFADDAFQALPCLAAFIGALLLQITVNLANDYFDFTKGVDSDDRVGPIRVIQKGIISLSMMRFAIAVTLGVSLLIGIYLIYVGGWPILAIGVASILAALAYSGGPYPLGSHGMGDLLVFIFFGLVAVCGTYYLQTIRLTYIVVVVSIPMGLLITAILVVNNMRDIETDREAMKYTLAVILGRKGAMIEYFLLLAGAYLIPILLYAAGIFSPSILLTFLSLPFAVYLTGRVFNEKGRVLNAVLAKTAQLTLIYSLLFSAGIILSN
ncbi:1,4-dihydroxy-2-naphthoate polyprenyltransferase [Thermodesulfobacteriota bacterium]